MLFCISLGWLFPHILFPKSTKISFKNRNCFSDKKSPISFYRYGIHFNYYWFLQLVPKFAMNVIGSYWTILNCPNTLCT